MQCKLIELHTTQCSIYRNRIRNRIRNRSLTGHLMNHTDRDVSLARLQRYKSALGCSNPGGIPHSESTWFLLLLRFRILIGRLLLSTSLCKKNSSVKDETYLLHKLKLENAGQHFYPFGWQN